MRHLLLAGTLARLETFIGGHHVLVPEGSPAAMLIIAARDSEPQADSPMNRIVALQDQTRRTYRQHRSSDFIRRARRADSVHGQDFVIVSLARVGAVVSS